MSALGQYNGATAQTSLNVRFRYHCVRAVNPDLRQRAGGAIFLIGKIDHDD